MLYRTNLISRIVYAHSTSWCNKWRNRAGGYIDGKRIIIKANAHTISGYINHQLISVMKVKILVYSDSNKANSLIG